MMSALLVKSALDYVEFTSVMAFICLLVCLLITYQISTRRPLYYNLFVVEMHTWTARRMVQVLHLGQEFHPPVPWDRLVQRMRARAPRVQGENRIAISDTNIVIQSPNTVIDSPAPTRSPDVDLITLWDIEMPPLPPGQQPDATRDSQYAAAAAIAILARGDDASLLSRVFHNSQNRSSDENTGVIPSLNRIRNVNPLQNTIPSEGHDYVTTDVTYTTPASSDVRHRTTSGMADLTYTHPPTTEMLVVEEEEEDEPVNEPDHADENENVEETVHENVEDVNHEENVEPESATNETELEPAPIYQQLPEVVLDSPPTLATIMAQWTREGIPSDLTPARPSRRHRVSRRRPAPEVVPSTNFSVEQEPPSTSSSSPPVEEKVQIRLKFMNDTVKDTQVSLSDTLGKFKRDNLADVGDSVVRLIFQGQLLRDEHKTLENYGLQAGSVVHCHISNVPLSTPGVATLSQTTSNDRPIHPNLRRPVAARYRAQPRELPQEFRELAEGVNEEVVRRRAVQDRNVGNVYFVFSTLVPLLTTIGLAVLRPNRLRDVFRPTTLLAITHWVCNLLGDHGLLDLEDQEDEESTMQTATIVVIFLGQLLAVTTFFFYFPEVYERVGISIFLVVLLYFVFVIFMRHRRRQRLQDPDAQDEIIDEQVVHERHRLI